MAAFPPNRYREVEPPRVQHGRTFVTAHQPMSLGPQPPQPHPHPLSQQARGTSINTFAANGHGANTLRPSNTNGNGPSSTNTTKLNATVNASHSSLAHSQYGPASIPAGQLHPNHITDVFPRAIDALSKTEEHTYSGAHNPTVQGQHQHGYSLASHSSHAHHKLPLRGNPPPPHSNGPSPHNLFDPANMSGMEDSTYGANITGIASATPHLTASLATDRIAPLQRENLRLVRSNNALQAHLVAEGERIEECERTWAQELRTVKTKHADLQFLFAQKTRKIANQEQKITELQTRLEQVLSDRQAYVKESIESTSRLQPAPIQPLVPLRAVEPRQSDIDQLRAHEHKIAELMAELNGHVARSAEWTQERSVLLSKVATRDEEVKRLSEVLESERNWDKMHVEFELKKQFKTIGKLQQQIDFLNDQRIGWEKDIQSFKEMGVSASYMQQLQASQQQTKQMEGEYQQSVQRIHQLQSQIEAQQQQLASAEQSKQGVNAHAQEELEERERQIQAMQRKYDELVMDSEKRGVHIETLRTQLEQTRSQLPSIDVPLLQENYKREESARLVLRDQYTKLVREHDDLATKHNQTANELSMLKESTSRDLSTLNSDLLRAQYLNEDFQRRLRDLSETKANLSEESGALKSKVEITERVKEGLGGERDYYKTQVHELNGTVHHLKLDLQQRSDEIALLQRQIQSQEVQLNESVKDRSRLLHEQQADAATMHTLESTIAGLREDLQQARHQNSNLNDIVVERNEIMTNISDMNVTQRGLVRTNDKMKTQIDALSKEKAHLFERLAAVTAERDSFRQLLSSTDVDLASIQEEITKLHTDRDAKDEAYANLYHDYTDLSQQLATLKESKFPTLQAQIASLKHENDRLQAALTNVQENTVAKLTNTEHQLRSEVTSLKTALGDVQKRYEAEQDLTAESNTKITSLEHELHTMHSATSTRQSQLQSNATLLSHHADLISKLNLQISDLKGACRTLESQKSKVEAEWRHAMQEFEHVKNELSSQMDLHTNQSIVLQNKSQEIVELKTQLNALAEAKTQLEIDLHEQSQLINALHGETDAKAASANHLTTALSEHASHASLLQDTLRAKEHELSELLNQIQQLQRTNARLTEENNLKAMDLKAILQDLESCIKENQLLTKELSALKDTVDSRSADNERVNVRLSHTEEQYKAKELECLDLLSNYRLVCLENERIKVSADELEQERKSYRVTLKQQQDGLYKQEMQLRASESELRKRMVDIQSLEHTVQEATRALESQKKATDAAHAESAELTRALESARHLSTGMEHSRHDHLRVLTEYKSQVSSQQSDLHALQLDNTHLIAALQQSKDHASNLDKVIAQLRGQNALAAADRQALGASAMGLSPSSSQRSPPAPRNEGLFPL